MVKGLALGELNISLSAFLHEYTYNEVILHLHYHNKKKELENRNNWEQTRTLAYMIASANGYKGTRTNLMPFDWDNEVQKRGFDKSKQLTQEEVQKMLKEIM